MPAPNMAALAVVGRDWGEPDRGSQGAKPMEVGISGSWSTQLLLIRPVAIPLVVVWSFRDVIFAEDGTRDWM